MPTLMERQLDPVSAGLLRSATSTRAASTVLTEAKPRRSSATDACEGVRLTDGRGLPADLVVMAVGIRPNIGLAHGGRPRCQPRHRGRRRHAHQRSARSSRSANASSIAARSSAWSRRSGTWRRSAPTASPATAEAATSRPSPARSLKVTGIDCSRPAISCGDEADEEIVLRDAARGVYKQLVLRDDKLVGAVLYGDAARRRLVFRPDPAGAPISRRCATRWSSARPSPRRCHGIRRSDALPDTRRDLRLQRRLQGRDRRRDRRAQADHARRGARAHQGLGLLRQLHRQVEALLAYAAGAATTQRRRSRRCAIAPRLGTTRSARRFVEQKLKTIPAVMRALGWTTPDGCASCRPALNYYLLCAWPGEYRDDAQSRFVNERVHANIQKDGTYSVVPRMWGGVTTPRELRAIADVADKFDIPTVKVTGGQRIDLLGVKKEDLPAVWGDLNAAGMVSGHAYGKALRTVKTCVGTEWCRFGTQDSTGLGIKLEKMSLGLLDAAQGQARGLRLPAQLRRGDDQGFRRRLRRERARSSTSAAMAASRCASPICCARSRPRRRCWNTAAPSCSSTARRRVISSAPRPGSSASASTMCASALVDDADGPAPRCTRGSSYPSASRRTIPGRSARRAPRRTSSARSPEVE